MSSTNRGGKRSPADFYPTPAWCVHRVLDALPLPGGHWLEPGAGDGAIIDATAGVRSDVTWHAVELRDDCLPALRERCGAARVRHGDFLAADAPLSRPRYDVLFTNPPYSAAQGFLERGLAIADHVVLLLRLNFLASAKRAALMRERAPDVFVLPNRPSFTGHGTDSVEYAWFHWPAEHRGVGTITVLPTTPMRLRRPGPGV